MKTTQCTAIAVISLFSVSILSSNALVLDFSSVPGASINFNGSGAFSFPVNGAGFNFDLTSSGASEGLDGYISPGTLFTIQNPINSPFSGLETANVTGTGTFSISDGGGFNLTGTIIWSNAATFVTSGTLNFNGSSDLTSITYHGGNSDLQALASAGDASVVVSFNFPSAMSLSELQTTPASTSFSGSISASPVPEPGVWTLLGTGLASLFCLNLLRRRK